METTCICSDSLRQDRRQFYLKNFLTKQGYSVIVSTPNESLELECNECHDNQIPKIILLPIPVSPSHIQRLLPKLTKEHMVMGGHLPAELLSYCKEHEITCIDYLKLPGLAMQNAVATAEGAICQGLLATEETFQGSNVLVIGFGKCGEILADKLRGLNCNVYFSTRNAEAEAKAVAYGFQLHEEKNFSSYLLIYNTAPAMVIDKNVIDKLSQDTVIIDIASAPGGTDFHYCIKKGIVAKHCPGLPGKYAPKTSAKIIYDKIRCLL